MSHRSHRLRVAVIILSLGVVGNPASAQQTKPLAVEPTGRSLGPPIQAPASKPAADDSLTRNAAARSRMLECGHQWSSMKKAGTAAGTWKDFSRVCLARQ